MSETLPQFLIGDANDGVLVINVLIEELRDHEHVDAMRDQANAMLDETGARHLMFDLANLNYVTSIGLTFFLGVRHHFGTNRIVLFNMTRNVRRVFEYCRLITEERGTEIPFEFAETKQHAEQRLRT